MGKGRVSAAVAARPYELQRLRDPQTAAAYLSIAAKDEDPAAFLQALRNVTQAIGGVSKIAERTGLNRQQLYRTLSKHGNPELRSLTKILDASGVRLQFVARLTAYAPARGARQPAPKDYLARLKRRQPRPMSAAAARALDEENRGAR